MHPERGAGTAGRQGITPACPSRPSTNATEPKGAAIDRAGRPAAHRESARERPFDGSPRGRHGGHAGQRVAQSVAPRAAERSGRESVGDGYRCDTTPDRAARTAARRPAGRPAEARTDVDAGNGGDGAARIGAGRPGRLPGHRGHPHPDAGPPDAPPVRCGELVTAVACHRRRDGRCGWPHRPASGRCRARGARRRLRRRQHRPQVRRPPPAARPRLGGRARRPEGADAGSRRPSRQGTPHPASPSRTQSRIPCPRPPDHWACSPAPSATPASTPECTTQATWSSGP